MMNFAALVLTSKYVPFPTFDAAIYGVKRIQIDKQKADRIAMNIFTVDGHEAEPALTALLVPNFSVSFAIK